MCLKVQKCVQIGLFFTKWAKESEKETLSEAYIHKPYTSRNMHKRTCVDIHTHLYQYPPISHLSVSFPRTNIFPRIRRARKVSPAKTLSFAGKIQYILTREFQISRHKQGIGVKARGMKAIFAGKIGGKLWGKHTR
jgi:hypothetical protein